ncbi:MAG TPA: EpsI family protein [Povalibacter sp.]|nr:EpsI family protein [Povalibacter sp.]
MATTSEQLERPASYLATARPFVVISATLLLALVALWPNVIALVRVWDQQYDYSHGPLIVLVALVWYVRMRERIDAAAAAPSWFGLSLLLLTLGTWLIAWRGSSEMLQDVLLPLILWLAAWTVAGNRVGWLLAAPVAYLYFAIPVWEHLVPFLQWLTTGVTERALMALHVPATVSGNEVTLPAGTFLIAEGCAGKRYLIVALPLAVMMGALSGLKMKRLVLLVAIAALLAIVTNCIRVTTIVWLGHVTNMRHYLVAVEHVTFGLVLFVPLMIGIVAVARLLTPRSQDTSPSASPGPREVHPLAPGAWVLAATPLVLVFAIRTLVPVASATGFAQHALPVLAEKWQGPVPPDVPWRLHFEGADMELQGSYLHDEHAVAVYVNAYASQAPGRELVYFRNSAVPDGWSHVTRIENGKFVAVGGSAPEVLRARDVSGEQWLIARIYNVAGTLTTRPLAAQMLYGWKSLFGAAPAGFVAMAIRCHSDCNDAERVLAAFWQEQGPAMTGFIQPVKS